MISLIVLIFVVVGMAIISRKIFEKTKIPEVVLLILLGLILGLPGLKDFFISQYSDFISIIGSIGLFALMFLAGCETSWNKLIKGEKNSILIAFLCFAVPFILGSLLFHFLGFSLTVSIIGGAAMSITAEATKARVLLDVGKLKTRVGTTMIGAGIIDDVLGMTVFVIVVLWFVKVFYFKEILYVLATIAFFFLGILFRIIMKKRGKLFKGIEKILFLGIIPFFFVSLGSNFNFGTLLLNPMLLILVVIFAIIGKMLGSFIAKPLTNFSWKQAQVIGWGMNSRGAIELALAIVALKYSLIPEEVYSSLVVMALTTTLIFPFALESLIRKNPKIMN